MVFKLFEAKSTMILAILAIVGGLVHLLPGILTPLVQSLNLFGFTLQMAVGLFSIGFGALVLYESM